MDLLTYGDTKLIYKFNVLSNKVLFYDKKDILDKMQLDEKKWNMFCILSGCDYCSRIQGLGNVNAYKIVKNNTEEELWTKLKEKFTDDDSFKTYKSKFENAYSIFSKTIPVDSISIKTPMVTNKTEVLNFLEKYTNLTIKQIKNRLTTIDSNYRFNE